MNDTKSSENLLKTPAEQDKGFLKAAADLLDLKRSYHFAEHTYHRPTDLPDSKLSGTGLFNVVVALGGTSGYYPPLAEMELAHRDIRERLRHLVNKVTNIIDAGPGSFQAVIFKSSPTVSALLQDRQTSINTGQLRYFAIDMQFEAAAAATTTIRNLYSNSSNVKVMPTITDDFTRPRPLDLAEGRSLILLYGLTASQFPITGKLNSQTCNQERMHNQLSAVTSASHVSFEDMMTNFRTMIKGNGYILMTIDTNNDGGSALDAYRGRYFREFKENTWHMLRMAARDPRNGIDHERGGSFNPNAMRYTPRWDEDNSRIIHAFRSDKDQVIHINGIAHPISSGTTYNTGYSYKWSTVHALTAAEIAGWKPVHIFDHNSSPVKALLLRAMP